MRNNIYLNIYPNSNTLKQRLVVILSTILGIPYHLTINKENIKDIINEQELNYFR